MLWTDFAMINQLISIRWTGPNGYQQSGLMACPLLLPGDYCITVIDKELCVAQYCIYVPLCTRLPNGPLSCTTKTVDGITGDRVNITSVSPNPFTYAVMVNLLGYRPEMVHLYVIDQFSNTVLMQDEIIQVGDNVVNLSLPGLDSGIYYVQLIDGSAQTDYKMIVK